MEFEFESKSAMAFATVWRLLSVRAKGTASQ